MYRFEHNEFWWLLLVIPIIVTVFIIFIQWRNKSISKLGNTATISSQINGVKIGRHTTKFILIITSILFAIIGLMNLRKSDSESTIERKGIDLIFALDVSKSMLAEDSKPNRLEKAKQLINAIINKMNNNRIGLVVFAGYSYLQVPITIDYGAAKMLLDATNPSLIPTQGTVLSEAIELSTESFTNTNQKHKAIILISDGEDHEEDAVKAAQKANKEGAIIYTIGIGSAEGTTLLDEATQEPKTDVNGQPIITKLNEQILKDVAHSANGKYIHLGNINDAANAIIRQLNSIEKDNYGALSINNYKSYYYYFVWIAFILFVLEWSLPYGIKKINSTLQS